MAFEKMADLDCDTTTQIGGTNKETKKPNPKSIEGYFVGTKITDSKYGPSCLHVFQTKTGNIGVWGKTDLDQKLGQIKPGTMVRATFDRLVPSNKGNDKWVYRVEFDRENTIEVAAADGASDDAGSSDYTDESAPDESDLSASDDDQGQPEELPVTQPKRPSQPAKPNAAKTQALLSGRRSA